MEFLSIVNILLLASAYVLGSIPTSIWAGKIFHDIDIRKHGSQNAGATNSIRVLGLKTGVPVLLFDIFKGWLTCNLIWLFSPGVSTDEGIIQVKLLLGLFGVMGHLYPVFANFKGGKGIATLLGMFLAIHAPSAVIALGIFTALFIISRIVSLGSIIAVTTYPVITWFVFGIREMFFTGVLLFFVFVVLYTHRQNIKRLLAGKEKKLNFSKSGERG